MCEHGGEKEIKVGHVLRALATPRPFCVGSYLSLRDRDHVGIRTRFTPISTLNLKELPVLSAHLLTVMANASLGLKNIAQCPCHN